jgi:hypothetical protein
MGLEGWVTEQAEDTYDDRGRRVSGSLSGYGLGPAGMKLESAILRRVEQMIAKSQQPVQTPAIEQEKTVTFDAASFRDANGRVMVSVVRQSNGRYRVIGGPDDSESREAGLSTAQPLSQMVPQVWALPAVALDCCHPTGHHPSP